jgi:hypothetical protein
MFGNVQVLRYWPIEPAAGLVQASDPGLTALNVCVGKSASAFDFLIEQSSIEVEPEKSLRRTELRSA